MVDTNVDKKIQDMELTMTMGFAKIDKRLDEIQNSIDTNKIVDKAENDTRYCQVANLIPDAVEALEHPRVRAAAQRIVPEYLDSTDGRIKIGCMIDNHYAEKRDSASKWFMFLKATAGIVLALLLAYSSIESRNRSIETKEMIQSLKTLTIGGE